MKLGTETGSLINHFSVGGCRPEIGMGATILGWSDRYPATIVKITNNQIHVQADHYKRVDKNRASEDQEYEYIPNPEASIIVFRLTKRGFKSVSGYYLSIGERERYYDFTF